MAYSRTDETEGGARPERPVAVLIAFHYPPSREVGGLRAVKVAETLWDAGYQVTVVTADLPDKPAADQAFHPKISVRSVPLQRGPFTWYSRFRRRGPGQEGGQTAAAVASGPRSTPERPSSFRRILRSFQWLPDTRQGFIWPAFQAARRLNPQLVYTTAPPFSSHLAGLLLKRLTGARWVAEFRDPWMDNPWKPPHLRSKPADAVGRWLERQTLRAADRIIAVTQKSADRLGAKIPEPQRFKCTVIRNGIDQRVHEQPGSGGKPVEILHVGSIYHKRNPFVFLEALARVCQRHRLSADDVRLHFVGSASEYNGKSLESRVQDLNLSTVVRFTAWVPHETSKALMQSAGALLLLAQEQPLQVPNKLYEYLATGIPILALADEDGETADMLRQVGGHFVLGAEDQSAMEAAIEVALGVRPAAPGAATDRSLLMEWTSAVQMGKLRTLLTALLPSRVSDSRTGRGSLSAPPPESPVEP